MHTVTFCNHLKSFFFHWWLHIFCSTTYCSLPLALVSSSVFWNNNSSDECKKCFCWWVALLIETGGLPILLSHAIVMWNVIRSTLMIADRRWKVIKNSASNAFVSAMALHAMYDITCHAIHAGLISQDASVDTAVSWDTVPWVISHLPFLLWQHWNRKLCEGRASGFQLEHYQAYALHVCEQSMPCGRCTNGKWSCWPPFLKSC